MSALDFWVPGPPYTKGSIECMPNGYPMQSPASYDYANRVQAAAEAEVARVGWEMATGPVVVAVRFFLPRTRDLRLPLDPAWPIGKGEGDIDKLQRNAFDPLDHEHARVYVDDSQIVHVDPWKFYARSTGAGTHVRVYLVGASEERSMRLAAEQSAADVVRRWRGLDGAPVPAGF